MKNCAFVFIKPHANTEAVQALVKSELEKKGLKIMSEGPITSEDIDSKKLIDQHYYAIASKATILKPKDLNIPEEKFQEQFGLSWKEALETKNVWNAMEACANLEITADELDTEWGKAKKAKKLVKFGGGFYCGLIEIEGKQPAYIFNGFFMSMRTKFTAPGLKIHTYVVEWEEKDLAWADFRGVLLGPTDPAEAPKESLRGQILADWEKLGLTEVPNVGDNGVHASASPFEGLAERLNWCEAKLEDDAFGKEMLSAGISAKFINDGCVDPQVTLEDGKKGSLFDALEDLDAAKCLEKLVALSKLE